MKRKHISTALVKYEPVEEKVQFRLFVEVLLCVDKKHLGEIKSEMSYLLAQLALRFRLNQTRLQVEEEVLPRLINVLEAGLYIRAGKSTLDIHNLAHALVAEGLKKAFQVGYKYYAEESFKSMNMYSEKALLTDMLSSYEDTLWSRQEKNELTIESLKYEEISRWCLKVTDQKGKIEGLDLTLVIFLFTSATGKPTCHLFYQPDIDVRLRVWNKDPVRAKDALYKTADEIVEKFPASADIIAKARDLIESSLGLKTYRSIAPLKKRSIQFLGK